ncbi:unnamed protein product [Mytilus edulis]|uniref:Uncharacterized protein n=1 Tax=Mytilus edulis TaxID=6550 RepID=A0A8S3V9M1_MYTED|nr:unnamed protein product [Mytilus edulis]
MLVVFKTPVVICMFLLSFITFRCDNLKQFENAFQLVRSDLSKHLNEIKRLEEDKSRLSLLYENEKENSKTTINALEAKVKQLLNEQNIQVEELKRTELKFVEAQKESNKYHESNEKLRKYNSELETSKTSLELKHKEHDEQMRKSESELRQLEKDRKQIQQKVNEVEREYLDSNQAYKDQNSELLIDIGKARKEIKAQNEKSKVAKETYEREKTCNDDVIHKKEDIICILKSENQSLKDINHAKEKEIAKMKEIEIAKHIQMETQMEDLEKKRKSLVDLQKEKTRLYKARMEGVELDFALFKERISGSREHFKGRMQKIQVLK